MDGGFGGNDVCKNRTWKGNLTKRSIAYMLILAMFCLFLCLERTASRNKHIRKIKG